MGYGFFYDIAEYGNENWKGNFTAKEVAQNAYDYLLDFEYSCEKKKLKYSTKELCRLLEDDGSEECTEWLNMILREIKR